VTGDGDGEGEDGRAMKVRSSERISTMVMEYGRAMTVRRRERIMVTVIQGTGGR